MLKSQFSLEVSGGADSSSASIPLQASARNLEDPTSAKICAHCLLTILNTSQRIVSFKVLTNAQNRYSIRPALGILQPSESLDITVGVSRKHASDPPGVILLRYVKLPDNWCVQNDLASFWSNAPKEKVKALKLVQSIFEPDSASYSMHSSFSGTSSVHGHGSPAMDAESDFHDAPAATTPAIYVSSSQLRSAALDRDASAAAPEPVELPAANATAVSSISLNDASRAHGVAKHSGDAAISRLLLTGTQIARVSEAAHVPHSSSASFSTLASFVPVETSHHNLSLVSSVDDAGFTAGPRSDSRTSTLSDNSHRTDDAKFAIDHDMVVDFEKMRAAVSSVKTRPKSELQSYTHVKARTKDSNSSEVEKYAAAASVDEPPSHSRSGNEPSAPPVSSETSATVKRSRYPPVEACVSSITLVTSADSFLQRFFPSPFLSDQPIYVRMDPNMLQLLEGEIDALLLLKIRWKDVAALSMRTCSTAATILLLVSGNSGNESSCARDIKACDSLVNDAHHKMHLISIKGSPETISRMVIFASRCNGESLQSLPHWLWIAARCRFPGSAPLRAKLCNSALFLPHSLWKFLAVTLLLIATCVFVFYILTFDGVDLASNTSLDSEESL